MVDKFLQILTQISRERGDIFLLALLKMDELTDKWSVILSAPWSTDATRQDDFIYLRGLILRTLTTEEVASIARLGIFSRESHIIEALLQYRSGTTITDGGVRVNGNLIHEGYILASNRNLLQTVTPK